MAKDDLQPETLGGPSYPKDSSTDVSPINLVNPDNTLSGTYRGVQQLGGPSLIADAGNKRILVNDGTNRVLMGNQPTFGEGFFVSKSGVDVTQTTNAADFIFNSNQNVLKVVQTGTTTIPSITVTAAAGSGVSSVTIAHNLGFIPVCLAFTVDTNFGTTSRTMLPSFHTYAGFTQVNTADAGPNLYIMPLNQYINAQTDATNVTFANSITDTLAPSGGNLTSSVISIKYYLLQETAN